MELSDLVKLPESLAPINREKEPDDGAKEAMVDSC